MKKTLNGDWLFRQADKSDWHGAKVPGCNFTDLLDNGMIDDPFVGINEKECEFVGKSDWEYSRTFTVSGDEMASDEIFLCFDMIDTLASIYLNGKLIGNTENCFRRYEFPVKSFLSAGENEIRVYFKSPVNYVSDIYKKEGAVPNANGQNGIVHIRKPQSHFGWDWGPVLVPCGITGDVYLEFADTARLGDVSVLQEHKGGKVTLKIRAGKLALTDGDTKTSVSVTCPDGSVLKAAGESAEFVIDKPELWWTYKLSGKDVQPLYEVNVKLKKGRKLLDEKTVKIGLRTLELNREKDKYGQQFCFVLNGVPIFAKGANVIPADQFVNRFDSEKREKFFNAARFANMNMLRVWGGGYYADDAFLTKCDEMGILVWQDFQFSCQAYPFFKQSFLDNVRKEIAYNVARMHTHPSLALWCGNNEIEQMHAMWLPFRDYLEWTEKFFYGILENEIRKIDTVTPYIPGSPCGVGYNKGINHDNVGDSHIWSVWHGLQPMNYYRKRYARFCSEFGFESLPDIKTIKGFANEEDYDLNSPVFLSHQKCNNGNSKMVYYIASRFDLPARFEDYVYLSQVTQMECVEDATSHWRRNRGRCNGALYWQFNDCWPVCSWAGMDYNYNYKALQYAARRFNAPVCVSVEDSEGEMKVFVHNDLNGSVNVRAEVFFFGFVNGRVDCFDEKLTLKPLEVANVFNIYGNDVLKYSKKKNGFCVRLYSDSGEMLAQKVVLLDKEKNIALPKAKITKKTEIKDRVVRIYLKADRFARLVCVSSDISCEPFSDNFFDLLPGQEYTVTCAVPAESDAKTVADSIRVISLCDIERERNIAKIAKNKLRVLSSPINIANIIIRAGVPEDLEV